MENKCLSDLVCDGKRICTSFTNAGIELGSLASAAHFSCLLLTAPLTLVSYACLLQSCLAQPGIGERSSCKPLLTNWSICPLSNTLHFFLELLDSGI